jgi:hypothetical protein
MDKVRKVENLTDIEELDYGKALKDKTLVMYENELSMIESASPFSNIPSGLDKLNEQSQYFLYYYLTDDIEVNGAGKKTYRNHILSFIMTFPNWKEIVERLFKVEPIVDEYGREVDYKVTKRDPVLYTKWDMRAKSYWNDNQLAKHVKDFEMILRGNISERDELKRAILNDALNGKTLSERTNNRKMFIDIEGMKSENNKITFNVFKDGGGQQRSKALSDNLGISKYDLSDVIDE